MSEKQSSPVLPTWHGAESLPSQPKISYSRRLLKAFVYAVALGSVGYLCSTQLHGGSEGGRTVSVLQSTQSACGQSPILTPRTNLTDLYSEDSKQRIIDWLSGAVQIPTESFDTMGEIGVDPRWDVFGPFHEYLEKKFPLVYKHLQVEKIDTWALAFEWTGKDSSKKPLMLTGHQDVVPVEPSTVGSWTHPPFSGHYDGEYIWGRGCSDDKSGLIGIMSAVELLLESGFQPERTVVLAFGMDEETGGKVGAMSLGKHLEAKYGKDSMYMLVDEGNGLLEQYGQVFAMPAVAEKGYLDVELSIATKGGHSSVPPAHTGIGLLAKAISELEANPVPLSLTRQSTFYEGLQCLALYSDVPKDMRKLLEKAEKSDKGLKKIIKALGESKPEYKASMGTTRAVDIVYGGVKVNALPELSTAVINHRINADSSVAELQEQMIHVLSPLAKEYDLSFEAFGKNVSIAKNAMGKLKMAVAYNSALEPAPISPHDTSSPAWNLLSGSVKSTYATRKDAKGDADKAVIMAPGLAIGNTDTKRYWNLTRNIYRFGYLEASAAGGIHTVDEHVKADAIVEEVRFFQTLILNADEAKDE